MTKVHVLAGGNSPEREVSLRSGAAVAEALEAAGYQVVVLDPSTTNVTDMADCDVIFPALHGAGGEDGILQKQLEDVKAKFVGSDSTASALCFNKWQYRQAVTTAGIQMAAGSLVHASDYLSNPLATEAYVLKPVDGGSTIDTYIVRDITCAPHDEITAAFGRHREMLMEKLIAGDEITVAVLGDQALPVIEIVPPAGGEFDYENKYNGATQEIVPTQNIAVDIQERAQKLALQAHQITGCRDFSRSDFMIDASGELYLLETNTIPGLTNGSLFPKAARAAGIEMSALCKQLVEMALAR